MRFDRKRVPGDGITGVDKDLLGQIVQVCGLAFCPCAEAAIGTTAILESIRTRNVPSSMLLRMR